jgi:hypothetical protein
MLLRVDDDAIQVPAWRRPRRAVAAIGVLGLVTAATLGWRHLRAPKAPTADQLAPLIRTTDILSEVFVVDRKYPSMTGPKDKVSGSLLDVDPPELLWITGYRAVMMDETGEEERPQEFMCHANLNIDIDTHRKRFAWAKGASPRLFTLSQGQQEVAFPPGFGIPVASDEELMLGMQVLNLNVEGDPFRVRHRVTISFVRDSDLPEGVSMRPLFLKGAAGLVSLSDSPAYFNTEDPEAEEHGEGCMVGQHAHGKRTRDRNGKGFSGHWVVKPGRQENHTLVTRYMNLPFDTRVHYVAVHLHPFAESLELRDLSAGKTVFRSTARNFSDKIGLEHVDYYSSAEGFELFDDHEYELVSVYDNTSGVDQDSMAVMFLYVEDLEYERPPSL